MTQTETTKEPGGKESRAKHTTEKKRLFLERLRRASGNISNVCRAIGTGRRTYYDWLEADPEFKKAVDDIQESLIDDVESALYGRINSGDTTAMIFFLKTRAKHRGYIEKTEHFGEIKLPIRLIYENADTNARKS